MQVRPATMADADAVTALWVDLATGQRRYGSYLLSDENASRVREAIARSIVTGNLLIATDDGHSEEGGSIAGFVMVSVDRDGYEVDVTRGIVDNLYVRPEYRNERVGSELLEAGERLLRDHDVDVISLEAMADNDAAQRFYERHGYTPHRIEYGKCIRGDTEDTGSEEPG